MLFSMPQARVDSTTLARTDCKIANARGRRARLGVALEPAAGDGE
jgi:hypothetical protein